MIVSRVPELLAKKFEGETLNLRRVQKETGLSQGTVNSWAHGHPGRFDSKILNTWCEYFGCDVADVLVRIEE